MGYVAKDEGCEKLEGKAFVSLIGTFRSIDIYPSVFYKYNGNKKKDSVKKDWMERNV